MVNNIFFISYMSNNKDNLDVFLMRNSNMYMHENNVFSYTLGKVMCENLFSDLR